MVKLPKQQKLIFLILLIVIIYFGVKYWQTYQVENKYDITQKKECLSKKGQWVTWGEGWFCNNFYEDGGEVCQSENECSSGKCLADEYSKTDHGRCGSYFNVPGCFDLLSDGGKHTGFSCINNFLRVETK
ncbi:MAG: hypothetical protein Q7S88_01550 [Candidatus Daviesbacteria bacterium]|nr:hypothetical protein [Candidatus Daviesbacteria bacterium]